MAGLALVLGGCGLLWAGTPVSVATAPTAPRQSLQDRLQRTVEDLADPCMQGRGVGTKGLDIARDYVLRRFQAAGLRAGYAGKFLQLVPVRYGLSAERQGLSFGPDASSFTILRPGEDFNVLGFSPDANFRGQAVFVGYGVRNGSKRYDSFAGMPEGLLKGKVAIALRYEPQDANGQSRWGRDGDWSSAAGLSAKALQAAKLGAVAVLIVNPPAQRSDTRLREPTETATGRRSPIPAYHVSYETMLRMLKFAGAADPNAQLVEAQALADEGGLVPRELKLTVSGSSKLVPHYADTWNVIGVLPGSGRLAGEAVIVGAHYDHVGYGAYGSRSGERGVHPGADDNASGTAGMLLLAERLARRVADGDAPADRRTLIFTAFTAEELGLIGSRKLAAQFGPLGFAPNDVAAMLNLDMVGRMRNNRLIAMGACSNDDWRQIAAESNLPADVSLRLVDSVGASDHMTFYYQLHMPVLHFFTGLHGEYHTTRDTADRMDPNASARALLAVERVVADVWTRPARPAYKPPKPSGAERGAYLGVSIDPTGQDKGALMMAVVTDGPAADAGLHDGDLVVGWDDKPIESPEDLLRQVQSAKPGDKVHLTVRRDGKELKLQVKLGRRF